MQALVVYESMWGNTRRVADAVGEGLGGAPVLDVHDVDADDLRDLDLLVVGGPTHAFSMTRASTRRDALERGAPSGTEDSGIREWLDTLPAELGWSVATFDTRVTKVRNLPGSAARSAGKELRKHHRGHLVAQESFYVHDVEGPLVPGELDRAHAWGETLRGSVPADSVTA